MEEEVAKYEEKQKRTCFMRKVNLDFNPIPKKGSLRDKFVYFYKPYSFEANTKRGMEFDEDVDWEKAKKLYDLQ